MNSIRAFRADVRVLVASLAALTSCSPHSASTTPDTNGELMTIFGVTDKPHWLVLSGHADAPVIFDGYFDPKPAYGSLLAELQSRGPKVKWTPTR